MKAMDLTGRQFGKLTVVSRVPSDGLSKWLCKCECGNTKAVFGTNLLNGRTNSCGCSRGTHKGSRTPLYSKWCDFRRNTGIVQEWENYTAFRSWAESVGYTDGDWILRIDKSLPASPDNCKLRHVKK